MEWLETDGLGGFAMGNAVGIPSRRYHALLNYAYGSPANRITLLNAVEAWLYIGDNRIPLSTFNYASNVLSPYGLEYISSFQCNPWPQWSFESASIKIEHEIFMVKDQSIICLGWKAINKNPSSNETLKLEVRPLISGRSYHALQHENPSLSFSFEKGNQTAKYKPYESCPALYSLSNADLRYQPLWFNNLNYEEDRNRGADHNEDLASPSIYSFDLSKEPAVILFQAIKPFEDTNANVQYNVLREQEKKRRAGFSSTLSRSAQQYIVKRKEGKTIIAGYPWFADWGRDTFISMRGLCIANDLLEEAEDILVQWSHALFEGMMPNRFLEEGAEAEYNSVDASLWYIIACYDFIQAKKDKKSKLDKNSEKSLLNTIESILKHFIDGTKYNIACDKSDGLLKEGARGVQLTWMDAKIGDYVVTPRCGKAVEIQALWLNSLKIAGLLLNQHQEIYELGLASFRKKFWNEEALCLFDVIDVDHNCGVNDGSIRPNQIFAVGGLPFSLLESKQAALVVDTVERHLLVPVGLRTLAQTDSKYRGRYCGGSYERDSAYHQGTVWPWLIGPFVEAWVRVRSSSDEAKKAARARFLSPILENLNSAGLGHLSEIHDADFPHVSRGCPFQAWSVGEALRLDKQVLS